MNASIRCMAWFCGVAAAAAVLSLGACQTASTLSTTEALQITGSFKDTGFKAPPKGVDDVLAQLESAAGQNSARLNEAKAKLSEPEPADLRAKDRSRWFFDRARAAHLLGDINKELADYRQAKAVLDDANITSGTFAFLAHFELARTELLAGNLSRSLEIMKVAPKTITATAESETGASFAPIPLLSYAALAYADAGYLEQTEITSKDVANRYFNEQRYFHEWPRAGVKMVRASRDGAQGAVAKAKGELREAEALFRSAVDDFSAYKNFNVKQYIDYDRAILDLFYQSLQIELADVLRRQGRLSEAEAVARQTLTEALASHGRYSAHTADVLRRLTAIILEQGRLESARLLAKASMETLDAAGVGEKGISRAHALMVEASAAGAQGDWERSLEAFRQAEIALENDQIAFDGYLAGNPDRGVALLFGGNPSEAKRIFEHAVTQSRQRLGPDAYQTQELRGLSAVADVKLGQAASARNELALVAPMLMQGQSNSGEASLFVREWRRRLILETYLSLLSAAPTLSDQDFAETFRVGSALGRGLVERTIAQSGARVAANAQAAQLLREEQDANLRLSAINDQVSATLATGGDVSQLRAQADQLRRALDALQSEIETNHPDLAELINPKPLGLANAQALLRPGETLVVTYFGRDDGYVWAIRADGTKRMHKTSLNQRRLKSMVDEIRIALDPMPQTLADIPPFDVDLAHELYVQLLDPVRDVWNDTPDLIVAAHGPLGFLPLSVLPTRADAPVASGNTPFAGYRDVAWLARTHGVAVIPSAGALRTLRAQNGNVASRATFVGFGDPVFNPAAQAQQVASLEGATTATPGTPMRGVPVALRSLPSMQLRAASTATLDVLPRLPDTADELRAIARALGADPNQSLYLRERASERSVKQADLSGVATLAFATHGLIPGDLDGLTQPALAMSHPALAGGEGDGLLGADEILGLRLSADWIVLSACNTGSGDGRGAEAVSGLGRSFFYAGARALLVSNWPVHSGSATALTTKLFETYKSGERSKAQALRNAMTTLIDGPGFTNANGDTLFSYAHPLFWGPFSVVGSPQS